MSCQHLPLLILLYCLYSNTQTRTGRQRRLRGVPAQAQAPVFIAITIVILLAYWLLTLQGLVATMHIYARAIFFANKIKYGAHPLASCPTRSSEKVR
jgi:hypothetical protein